MQSRKRESYCKLFPMPNETLVGIVHLLTDDKPPLASLTLVSRNRHCLAPFCQSTGIHFDYSTHIEQFLVLLTKNYLREIDVATGIFPIGIRV
ncbi:hypothetical protein GGI43DRAFT_122310 [Trichoderma evansii]